LGYPKVVYVAVFLGGDEEGEKLGGTILKFVRPLKD